MGKSFLKLISREKGTKSCIFFSTAIGVIFHAYDLDIVNRALEWI